MTAPMRLILNADDFGYDPAVSRGIAEAMERGVVSSATFIVNGPHSVSAAPLARGKAIGLHLNLVRFDALTTQLQLRERDVERLPVDFVEAECHAQLERLAQLLGQPATHLDTHKHTHRFENVLEGLARAAKAHDLPVRSPDEATRAALRARHVRTNDVFVGDAGATAWWTLDEALKQLELVPSVGVCEWMCHPGHAPTALSSSYSAQREVELETFTSTVLREAMGRRGVVFSSWAGV